MLAMSIKMADVISTSVNQTNTLNDEEKEKARKTVKRMMQAWGFSDHSELAVECDVHIRTPSNWIQHKGVPWPMLCHCHQQTGRSLDWLYDGKEPPTTVTAQQRHTLTKEIEKLLISSEYFDLIMPTNTDNNQLLIKGLINCVVDVLTAKK